MRSSEEKKKLEIETAETRKSNRSENLVWAKNLKLVVGKTKIKKIFVNEHINVNIRN